MRHKLKICGSVLPNFWQFSPCLCLLLHCGPQSPNATKVGAQTSYRLERSATNSQTNKLFLNFSGDTGYKFSVAGAGIDSDVEMGTPSTLRDVVNLRYNAEAAYLLNLSIYQPDGLTLFRDTISWEYSLEVPPVPNVTWSEAATSDDKVDIIPETNLSSHVKELWINGDVTEESKGWHEITAAGRIPIRVTPNDGLKKITLKYRNIYGTESAKTISSSISKKSVPPANCQISVDSTTNTTGIVVVTMAATNDGDLYYLVSGDVQSSEIFTKFSSSTTASVSLSGGAGLHPIRVQIRDVAANYCPLAEFIINRQ